MCQTTMGSKSIYKENHELHYVAYKKGYVENQGWFLVLGALFRRCALDWGHTVFFLVSSIALAFLLSLTSRKLTDDLTRLFETLHWLTISIGIIAQVIAFIPAQPRYKRIFRSFGKCLYTYQILDLETNEEVKQLRIQGMKEKTFFSRGFSLMLYSSSVCFGLFLPVMAVITGEFFRPQEEDGIIVGIPCIVWFPIEVHDSWIVVVRIILMLWEFYVGFTIVNTVIGIQTTAISIGHTISYEFKVLQLTVRKFDERAKFAMNLATIKMTTKGQDETKLRHYMTLCLSDSVKHHQMLLEVVEDYVSIFYFPELVLLVSSTLVICLSAISITSDIPFEAKAISLIFTGSELVNVFVLCYYGQLLLDAHNELSQALYESNWTSYSAHTRQHVLIMLSRLNKSLSLSAGGFTAANLDTFAQVVKSSFSYFSLLQALKE